MYTTATLSCDAPKAESKRKSEKKDKVFNYVLQITMYITAKISCDIPKAESKTNFKRPKEVM